MKKWFFLALGLIAIIWVWVSYPSLLMGLDQKFFGKNDRTPITNLAEFGSHYGVFGDTYGALNALFSSLAAFGLLVSIVLQNESIKKSKADFRVQLNESKKQNFTNHFFFILEQRASFIQGLKIKDPTIVPNDSTTAPNDLTTTPIEGLNALAFVSHFFLEGFQKKERFFDEDIKNLEQFHSFFKERWSFFDQGQRNMALTNLYKPVFFMLDIMGKTDFLDDSDKIFYIGFLKSTMTGYDLIVLAFFGMFNNNAKEHIEKYGLLDNMEFDFHKVIKSRYKKEAFGQNKYWERVFISGGLVAAVKIGN